MSMKPETWIPIVVIIAVMAFRLRRVGTPVRLNPARLWVLPALYTVVIAILLALRPPAAAGWLAFGAALLVGAALGWQRGRLAAIHRHDDGGLLVTQSRAAMALLAGVILVRQFARQALAGVADGGEVLIATDALLGFGLGLIAATRIEWGVRIRRLLAEGVVVEAETADEAGTV